MFYSCSCCRSLQFWRGAIRASAIKPWSKIQLPKRGKEHPRNHQIPDGEQNTRPFSVQRAATEGQGEKPGHDERSCERHVSPGDATRDQIRVDQPAGRLQNVRRP